MTGTVAKEFADLWPRIASNASSIALLRDLCESTVVHHSVQ